MGRRTVALGVAAIGAVSVGVFVARGLRGPSRLPAVPEELTTRAEVPGIPRARYWVGSTSSRSSATCSRPGSVRRNTGQARGLRER